MLRLRETIAGLQMVDQGIDLDLRIRNAAERKNLPQDDPK
jgi:hypothetical protein